MEINKISLSDDGLQVDRISPDKFFKSANEFEAARLSAENAKLDLLREKAAIEMSRAWSEERGFNHNSLTIEEKEAHD